MKRRLVIDGNAVYEIDEECVLKKQKKYRNNGRSVNQENNKQKENKDGNDGKSDSKDTSKRNKMR